MTKNYIIGQFYIISNIVLLLYYIVLIANFIKYDHKKTFPMKNSCVKITKSARLKKIMQELSSLLEIGLRVEEGGQKFMEVADKVRRIVSPKETFPGMIIKLNDTMKRQVATVLNSFAAVIFSRKSAYKTEHFIRAIDALSISSIILSCRYIETKNKEDIKNAIDCIESATSYCYELASQNLQYCGSYSFNIASLLYQKKFVAEGLEFFRYSEKIFRTTKNQQSHENCCKYIAFCLIVLDETNTEEFVNAINGSSESLTLLSNWINRRPPEDTKLVYNFIKKFKSKGQAIQEAMPYFALQGDLQVIAKDQNFNGFFPNFEPPRNVVYTTEPEAMNIFKKCWSYYNSSQYLYCAKQCKELLKIWPQKGSSGSKLAVLFIHVWIINSFFALNRPDCVSPYVKQLSKIFSNYPWVVGLASFFSLKEGIYSGNYKHYIDPPQLKIQTAASWEHVASFRTAMECLRYNISEGFQYFEELRESPNILIKREAFHYISGAYRLLGFNPCISDFENECKTSKETYALFMYHSVIDYIKDDDIDAAWSFVRPINVDSEMLKVLQQAEAYAAGHCATLRKIKLLQAVLLGNTDPAKCAELITKSCSTTLDSFIKVKEKVFKPPFPFMSLAYFNVAPLESCLLFALYTYGQPLVVRIKTDRKFDDVLDGIEEICKESTNLSGDMDGRTWWKKKYELDVRMEKLIKFMETDILGFWSSLFTPAKYSPSQNGLRTILFTAMSRMEEKKWPEFCRYCLDEFHEDLSTDRPHNAVYKPISLICGKYMHSFPWEMLPCVRERGTKITRIPSQKVIANQCQKEMPMKVNAGSTFFILNPVGDLEKTEEMFKPIFNQLQWEGITQRIPPEDIIPQALAKKELYVFCGHGNGQEYFRYSRLVDDDMVCKASLLLMGCMSGALNDDGETDPTGAANYCVAAGASALVGALWNVTDGEIDRFLNALLDFIKNGKMDVEDAVISARSACKLQYLTGSAVVVYGFPAVFWKK